LPKGFLAILEVIFKETFLQPTLCFSLYFDDAVYYYLVFGDFGSDEPLGFECPNCVGPMVGEKG